MGTLGLVTVDDWLVDCVSMRDGVDEAVDTLVGGRLTRFCCCWCCWVCCFRFLLGCWFMTVVKLEPPKTDVVLRTVILGN